MTESTVRLTNGQRWTQKQFLDHYIGSTVSGTPTPVGDAPTPVDVDKSWYMDEGPGRYYHPGMFPIINWILNNRNLAPGTYDLATLAKQDRDIKARMSNYDRDVRSPDYLLRANVFGNESAKISGRVVVGRDGSKTFRQVEIQPMDTNFDFQHNTWGLALEPAREVARRIYDPENKGISYDIQYRGSSEAPGQYRGPSEALGKGRVYDTFTDSQLNGALRKASVYPDRMPAGLLSSVTGKPELLLVDEHRRYLDQVSGGQSSSSVSKVGAFATRLPSFNSRWNSARPRHGELGRWLGGRGSHGPNAPCADRDFPAVKQCAGAIGESGQRQPLTSLRIRINFTGSAICPPR
jgi:hypothetical protein